MPYQRTSCARRRRKRMLTMVAAVSFASLGADSFRAVPLRTNGLVGSSTFVSTTTGPLHMSAPRSSGNNDEPRRASAFSPLEHARNIVAGFAAASLFSAALVFGAPSGAWAENELSAKYGGGGIDTSLVDQSCLMNACALQSKACLADDPDCRKGLTCTAKCLGDNACITGCMARYGNKNLDNLLKCTIEDNECIKVAILEGGADAFGSEPRPPAPTVPRFDLQSLQGSWYKVVGYNPNYDCYACQRNTFSLPTDQDKGGPLFVSNKHNNELRVDVEFSMPHLMPDGSPPPPSNVRESLKFYPNDDSLVGSQSIGLNDYNTHELMVFDTLSLSPFTLHKGTDQEVSYSRTAHSEGEMFGLKFWENWYIIGENDPGEPEFKFVYYNGKTRQNTYEGAFVYSRTKDLDEASMKRVYAIARDAGMQPDQFCRIRNGCFLDDTVIKEPESGWGAPSNRFRGILASTRVSQLLGVEPVEARDAPRRNTQLSKELLPPVEDHRHWWHEVGDYLENPHRHFAAMDNLRMPMEWPDSVRNQ